jgi:hypothetical protein
MKDLKLRKIRLITWAILLNLIDWTLLWFLVISPLSKMFIENNNTYSRPLSVFILFVVVSVYSWLFYKAFKVFIKNLKIISKYEQVDDSIEKMEQEQEFIYMN